VKGNGFVLLKTKIGDNMKVTNNIVHVSPTNIRTGNLPNKRQEYWRLSKFCYTTIDQLSPSTFFLLLILFSFF